MKVLLDTNVLLRQADQRAAESHAVSKLLTSLVENGDECCICSQNLVELWVVLTRPVEANGYGLEPAAARSTVDSLSGAFEFLPDPPNLPGVWLDLCTAHAVRGRQAYDARLAALVVATGIAGLVTLNPVDFKRFSSVKLLVPDVA